MKENIDISPTVVGDFNSSLSIFDFLKSRHKVSKSTGHLDRIVSSNSLTNLAGA